MTGGRDRNLLDLTPVPRPWVRVVEADGTVGLDVIHTSWADRLAQKLWKKPEVTHVRLEEFGAVLWPRLDGERTVYDLALLVEERFGAAAEPLFQRIARYFVSLHRAGYIAWKGPEIGHGKE